MTSEDAQEKGESASEYRTMNKQDVIVRSCSWESDRDEDGPCSQFALPPNTMVHYCVTCDTDECNSAVSHQILSTLIFLPVALLAPRYLHL
ncbi:Hypothetical protein NTJ_04542 [Nesidiocoris tenuis]|uniref:Protein sleepless n=1 Tax=Nesidiocoris tenuis TaxID=355587 RepID=A0ABN7AHM0_9HEMI|nr:Hypothetical protein NTJ_04542 [Nesidiocoris tenuis]